MAKLFFHFRPILDPHIFGLKMLWLLKLGIFTHFSTNFRYGFDFLILCLNFQLQTFKNARFFKNIHLFTLFLKGHILHRKYYSPIKLAMLLKYTYDIVINKMKGGSCNRFWEIMNQIQPVFWKSGNCTILWALVDNVGNILEIWNFAQSLLTATTISYVNFKNVSQL